jgi:hypothetical protein
LQHPSCKSQRIQVRSLNEVARPSHRDIRCNEMPRLHSLIWRLTVASSPSCQNSVERSLKPKMHGPVYYARNLAISCARIANECQTDSGARLNDLRRASAEYPSRA